MSPDIEAPTAERPPAHRSERSARSDRPDRSLEPGPAAAAARGEPIERPTEIAVGLAQIDCRLGDLDGNVERHLAWIERGRAAGADFLVFPELSLTGYRLLHLTPRVALRPDDPRLARLAEAAGPMAVVLGFVEEDERGVLHNSAVVLGGPSSRSDAGAPRFLHRKIYLPTYGIFQDERFFGRGRRLDLPPTSFGGARWGILVCEDLWHPSLASRLAIAGAKLLVVPSASPGRVGAGPVPESVDTWETLTRATALVNTCWLLYCNRVGWEEGSFYPGGSHVVRPGGEVASRAPILAEHLLVARINLRDADRLRWRLPILDDERNDVAGPEPIIGETA
jgi:N-carbamoylputrescine amidase